MSTTRQLIAGLAALTPWVADAASAVIAANTIDSHAICTREGARIRMTGPIGRTRGIAVTVTVSQAATAARARERWKGRCTSELQHWQVRAPDRERARFATRAGTACAVTKARRASRVTDTPKCWQRVSPGL